MPSLLEVIDLHTEFRTGAGVVRAVDGISYTVERGETVAIVGPASPRDIQFGLKLKF